MGMCCVCSICSRSTISRMPSASSTITSGLRRRRTGPSTITWFRLASAPPTRARSAITRWTYRELKPKREWNSWRMKICSGSSTPTCFCHRKFSANSTHLICVLMNPTVSVWIEGTRCQLFATSAQNQGTPRPSVPNWTCPKSEPSLRRMSPISVCWTSSAGTFSVIFHSRNRTNIPGSALHIFHWKFWRKRILKDFSLIFGDFRINFDGFWRIF